MSERRTTRIDVGSHEDKVGFTLYYEDGLPEHFLFSPDVARSLASKLLAVVQEIDYLERQLARQTHLAPGDGVRVSDHARVTIQPPAEG